MKKSWSVRLYVIVSAESATEVMVQPEATSRVMAFAGILR